MSHRFVTFIDEDIFSLEQLGGNCNYDIMSYADDTVIIDTWKGVEIKANLILNLHECANINYR